MQKTRTLMLAKPLLLSQNLSIMGVTLFECSPIIQRGISFINVKKGAA